MISHFSERTWHVLQKYVIYIIKYWILFNVFEGGRISESNANTSAKIFWSWGIFPHSKKVFFYEIWNYHCSFTEAWILLECCSISAKIIIKFVEISKERFSCFCMVKQSKKTSLGTHSLLTAFRYIYMYMYICICIYVYTYIYICFPELSSFSVSLAHIGVILLPCWENDHIIQGGSNMTGTDLYVKKPHCAAAVRPWESEATTSTLPPARVRTCSVLSGSC